MFKFANPYYFFLLIPACLAGWFIYRKRIKSALLFAATGYIPKRKGTWRTYAANIFPVLFLAGLILSIFGLARPQTVFSKVRRSVDVIAIEMVLDVSGSMMALDMSDIERNRIIKERTRLDVVKEVFSEFVEKRTDDLIGIITFGGYATTLSPLTTDHAALLHILKGVDVPKQLYDKNGRILNREELLTAIGDALVTGCARLENAEPESKIIVLLSDGESNTGIIKPEEGMEAAKKLGIKVYTIGIGSTGRAPFKDKDMLGRDVVVPAPVVLDEKMLRKIAAHTGAQYFNVKDPEGLEKAMEEIDKLEKTRIEKEEYNQYNELFPKFLWPGLGLIILGTWLNMIITRRIV